MNSSWDIRTWTAVGARIAAIVLLAILGLALVQLICGRLQKLAQSSSEGKKGRQKQLQTLIQVVRWIAQVVIIGATLLTVLGHFIDITPILASVGVVGLVVSLGDWAMTVRVMVKTPAGKQWGVAMELRKRILVACKRENVELPYPRQEILVRNVDSRQ